MTTETMLLTQEQMENLYEDDWYEANRTRNQIFLQTFASDLNATSLKTATQQRHLGNVELFLDMLADREGYVMEEAMANPGAFLGNWFIRRCMWSTPATIGSTAASLKKFAKSMLQHAYIDLAQYDAFQNTVKWNLEEWKEICRQHNSPDEPIPFMYPF